jgi:basic amino acid/polyamine antiporter, APA family
MGRNRDLPHWLAAVHPRYRVPHHAEVALAVIVCALVLTLDLRGAIGFSSFGVLVYYALTNASAFTLVPSERRRPRWFHLFGLVACLVLAATLPWASVVAGAAVFAVGLVGRALVHRWRASKGR